MKKKLILASAFLTLSPAFAVNYKQLAKEMTPLIDKMEAHDPAKLTMILRLADVLFEATVEVDKNVVLDAKAIAEMTQNQKKAVELYEYALSGLNGAVPKPTPERQYRIEFQLGRLYTDLGWANKADQEWRQLVQQKVVKQIQREAALRLAEKLEISNKINEISQAGELYDLALTTCEKADLCSYIEYRRGWIAHRLGKSDEGVQFLTKSIAKSDASSFDEILKDLSLFLAHSTYNSEKAIALLEKLELTHKRSGLVQMLAVNYFTADQRTSYYQTVQYLLKKDPHLDQYISIMEFAYSQAKFNELSNLIKEAHLAVEKKIGFSGEEKQKEAEKILFRMIFLWDGERKTRSEIFTPIVSQAALLFAEIYPKSVEYKKVVDGWLAVQDNSEIKMKQVELWRTQQETLSAKATVLHLMQVELSLAQQMKKWEQVVTLSTNLLLQDIDKTEVRNLTYQKAKALYELKKYDQALPIFKGLALPGAQKPDSIATYSQNLSLDILAQQNKYDEIKTQADLWTADVKITGFASKDKALSKELLEMESISEKALFEKAVSSKDKESLKTFKKFCFVNKFSPQSCENAMSLAGQLKYQQSTIEILRYQGKTEELASELEFAGFFSEAARERENLLNKTANMNSKNTRLLQVALLYEVGGALKERDRILHGLTKEISKAKTGMSEPEEALIVETLKDASMLNSSTLSLPLSASRKLAIASSLEDAGSGNSETKNMLMKTCQDLGSVWNKMQFEQLKEMNSQQAKISIVGRRSQENFKKRTLALKALSEKAQCFLKGSLQTEARIIVMSSIAKSYADFSAQIKAVPLPEGLDEETMKQVKEQIAEMAKPFDDMNESWNKQAKLALEQVAASERTSVEQKLTTGALSQWTFEMSLNSNIIKNTHKISVFDWDPLLKELRTNPYDSAKLGKLKAHFEEGGNKRLSSYFEGRLKAGGTE